MAIELVDGHAGRAHISSEDLAALNVGVVGLEGCIFDWGQNFQCTMSTSNRATIATGAGMVKGLRFWAKGTESLTVQSGSQGMKRHDLVVARYKKDPSGVESVALEVIKGAPHASTPSDPAVGADGMALWRIPLDGLSVGNPVRMAPIVPSLQSLGCKKLYENDYWRVIGHGGACTVYVRNIITEPGPWDTLDCKYKVPAELRPATECLAACCTQDGDGGAGFIRVKTDGTISVGQLGGSGTNKARFGQLTWVPGM